jgi:hypothetical protein
MENSSELSGCVRASLQSFKSVRVVLVAHADRHHMLLRPICPQHLTSLVYFGFTEYGNK